MRRIWLSLLSLGFRLLYNELAWTYDIVAWLVSFGEWEAWGRATLDYVRGHSVLELGHGPGHLLVRMKAEGLGPVGVDLSAHMGRLARKRLRTTGVEVPLIRARAQQLPFRDGTFDSVVATFPTDYIIQTTSLSEIHRVLETSGRLISAVVIRFPGRGLRARLLRAIYKATGQTGPEKQSEFGLRKAQFNVEWSWIPVGQAEVLLLVAQR